MLQRASINKDRISLADWARKANLSDLQVMLSMASQPGIISFALGLPAPELFPSAAYSEAVREVLSGDERALQYGPPSQALRKHVVELMAQRGVECKEEQVFLTTGAQQAMNLLARLLLNSSGQVMTEELTYTGFRQIIESLQPDIISVPADFETGIDVDAVKSILAGGARPAFIYAMSDGHNPLGVSMSIEKRRRLVDIARHYNTPIVEDDAYGFLYYDSALAPPLRAFDEEIVFYIGSFSKILAPALRVGWIIAPTWLMPKLSIIKEATDIDTATLAQRTIAAFLDAGHLPDHLTRLRHEYGLRRDAMLSALEDHFCKTARWVKPTSGVFIWVELLERVNATQLLKVALEAEQVAFISGEAFCVNGNARARGCMRLNFSNSAPKRIEEGIARLARSLEKIAIRSAS